MKVHDALAGAGLAALGAVVLWHIQGFPAMPGQKFGPAWFPGLIAAPKGIPAEAQKTLAAALKKVYDSKDYKEFMAKQGYGTVWADPAGTAKFMAASDATLGATLKAVGLAK